MEKGVEYWNTHIGGIDTNTLPHWSRLYKRIADVFPSDRNVAIADLGCDGGYFAKFIYKKGYKNYWGIDFASTRIKMARLTVPEFKFTVGSLYNKKIQRRFSEYDVFVGIEIFQLLEKELTVIDAIPKGKRIIMSVPSTFGIGSARYFKSVKEVEDRYGTLIDFDAVEKLLCPTKFFFLGYGIKR